MDRKECTELKVPQAVRMISKVTRQVRTTCSSTVSLCDLCVLSGSSTAVFRVNEELLRRWRKGHPFKVKLALKLRRETTVTVGWITQRLQMGTREHAAHLLSRAKKNGFDVDQPALSI